MVDRRHVEPRLLAMRYQASSVCCPRSRRSLVCARVLLGCLLILSLPARAQRPQLSTAVHSRSGQFIVQPTRPDGAPSPDLNPAADLQYLSLDSALVAVSCERIKQILIRELRAPVSWRGKIHIVLHPSRGADEPVAILPERFSEGWQYRVDLPNPVERAWYVRAIVQVVLQEMANRQAGEHSAEIPVWLNEGFTQRLLAFNETEIILTPPSPGGTAGGVRATFVKHVQTNSPLEAAHAQLRERPPLSFDALSWPEPDQFSGEKGRVYGCSAQLFLNGLLALRDGGDRLRAMLAELPQHYNWQFAFLNAFQAWFQRPRDIEKWWTLQTLHFTGHELTQALPVDESLEKLEQALRSAVQVRTDTNELPMHAEVALQTIVREWDGPQQTEALLIKQHELEFLQLWVPPEVRALVLDYRQAIAAFLQDRDRTGFVLGLGKQAGLRRLSEETAQRLDALDSRRETMRPARKQPPSQPPIEPEEAAHQ